MLRSCNIEQRLLFLMIAGAFLVSGQGCAFLTYKINGIPAQNLPEVCRPLPKRDLVSIDVTKLSQPAPDAYRLDAGDIIGIIVEGALPYRNPDDVPEPPPVHYPEGRSDLPPSIGIPLLVQVTGEITLPGLGRLKVAGLTLEESSQKVKKMYEEAEVKIDKKTPPLVTLIHARTYNVMVIREDTASSSLQTNLQNAAGGIVKLDAYKNDVLNALMSSGGLPGLGAKNEVRIRRRGGFSKDFTQFPNGLPNAPVTEAAPYEQMNISNNLETVIPLRIPNGTEFEIRPEDVILNEGDVVYIANRDSEVYYTGGLLPGGEHQLPRDRDIDVFEAMAIAGYSYGHAQSPAGAGGGGGAFGLASFASIIPTQLFSLRKRADGTQYAIEVDLEVAVSNECERLLIAPGDKLLLRYKPVEEVANFSIAAFFIYGIGQLLRR